MKRHGTRKKRTFAQLRKLYADGKKIKSEQLRKDSERIMDQLQSLQLRSHNGDPSAVREYAKEMIPKMSQIVRAYKRSDDPGGVWIEEGRLEKLKRMKDYKF